MLTDRERQVLFLRLDEVLTEMEPEPWPPEERRRYLMRELNRIESTLDADDGERARWSEVADA
jgi:hypothetical protein